MLKNQHKVRTICRVLVVNPSSYYKRLKKKLTKNEIQNQEIRREILSIYIKSDKRFGAYKLQNKLIEKGIKISVARIYRLLFTMNLPKMATIKPKYKKNKPDNDLSCENVLKQNFTWNEPNRAWVSDITYVKVGQSFCYVCVIIDLFSRKVIAYKCGKRMKSELVIETFKMALRNRNYPKNVIFHSDRGCQYTSNAFRKVVDDANFIQSFSKKGYPFDNACAESFFKYYKQNEILRRRYTALEELEISTFKYVEGFYNSYNPHSANDGLTPNEKESNFFNNKY
ncbi:MAG: IS3 family transposase [Clostridia bacterium]